ncbi:MAG: thioredoxin domain-containing protein [Gammaproteobacteria bacterium]|nr:MAG: thioredoxin domain-containing protein [Gammaproteobacteria bacterium]
MRSSKIIATSILLLWMQFFLVPAQATEPSISPYLDYHKSDRVQWLPWNTTTLQQARESRKLILISSGYFACHYCHLMKRESFEHQEIADFINQHFIPVLIDREIHTTLDAQLQAFMGELGAAQGWPLQIILTPEAHPLFGTTYRPPMDFIRFLQQTQKLWKDDPDRLSRVARQASEQMVSKLTVPAYIIQPSKSSTLLEALYKQALQVADQEYGGFGFDAKYPMSPQLLTLLQLQQHYPDMELKRHLVFTLEQMTSSDFADVIGGGFFRYATQRDWSKPHYEKMLYDNVQLALVYLQAAEVLQRPDFRAVADRTIDFLLREFSVTKGGFVSSLSAVDGEGVDGGYYVWKESELKSLLQADEYAAVRQVWHKIDIEHEMPVYLPRKLQMPDLHDQSLFLSQQALEKLLHSAESKLLERRSQRYLPRDGKRLAGWNGLALRLFVTAAEVTGNKHYRQQADALFRLITQSFWRDGYLQHSAQGGDAELADYAYVASGLLAYARLTTKKEHYGLAAEVCMRAWQDFHVESVWRRTQENQLVLPYTVYQVTLPDNELPSATAMLIAATRGLGKYIEADYQKMARQALFSIDANVLSSPFFYATQIQQMVTDDADQ